MKRALVCGLLALALLASGCLTSMEDRPPRDPTVFDYIYRADATGKAPHPVTYDGGLGSLTVVGAWTTVDWAGNVTLTAGAEDLEVPEDAPIVPPQLQRRLTIASVQGEVRYANGSIRSLEGETVTIVADHDLPLSSLASVRVAHATFEGDRAEAWAHAHPGTNLEPGSGARLSSTGGVLAEDVRIVVHETRAPAPAEPGQGPTGTLELEAASYPIGWGTFEGALGGAVPLAGDRVALTLDGPQQAVELRGAELEPSSVRLKTTSMEGTYTPDGRLQLAAEVLQWWTDDRPRFEAALTAGLAGLGQTAEVTLAPGENATFWLKGQEASEVGSAERVHVQVEDGPPKVALGESWYHSPNPHVLEQIASGLIEVFFGLFVDRTVTDFDPGQSQYLPVFLKVPDGTSPGSYPVTFELAGQNARSETVELNVTVVG